MPVLQMWDVSKPPTSDEALKIKRQEFHVSWQELTVEMERVMSELSYNAESFLWEIISKIIPILSESVLKEMIKDLKDSTSSQIEIGVALEKLLNGKISIPRYEPKITKFCQTLAELYRLYYEAIT